MAVWTAVLGRLPSGIDCNSVGGRTDARRDTLPWEGVLGGGISNRLEKKEIQDFNVMCMCNDVITGIITMVHLHLCTGLLGALYVLLGGKELYLSKMLEG